MTRASTTVGNLVRNRWNGSWPPRLIAVPTFPQIEALRKK